MSPDEMSPDERPSTDVRLWLRVRAAKIAAPPAFSPGVLDKGLRGEGVRVALLDSGLNWSPEVFRGARIVQRSFVRSARPSTEHGTQNAALLVGQGGGLTGLVPDTQLLHARVLGAQTWEAAVRAVSLGLRWASTHRADVIVLPFGSTRISQRVATSVTRAVERGAVVVAAGGNRGADVLTFPARVAGVWSATACDERGNAVEWCASPLPCDVVLPGGIPVGALGSRIEAAGSSTAAVLAAGLAVLNIEAERRSQGAPAQLVGARAV